MSEEEIIETFISIINSIYLQGYVKDTDGKISNNLKSVLDLYQKEKEKNKLLINSKFREVADKNSYVKDNYISKDRIKAKIEEILEYGRNLSEEERQKQTEFLQGKLKLCEELLEEED